MAELHFLVIFLLVVTAHYSSSQNLTNQNTTAQPDAMDKVETELLFNATKQLLEYGRSHCTGSDLDKARRPEDYEQDFLQAVVGVLEYKARNDAIIYGALDKVTCFVSIGIILAFASIIVCGIVNWQLRKLGFSIGVWF